MDEADLEGASLAYADLRGATLRRTDLRGVVFRGADMAGTDFTDATLSRAEGLTEEQINSACGARVTGLPSGMVMKPCPGEPVYRGNFMCAAKSRP